MSPGAPMEHKGGGQDSQNPLKNKGCGRQKHVKQNVAKSIMKQRPNEPQRPMEHMWGQGPQNHLKTKQNHRLRHRMQNISKSITKQRPNWPRRPLGSRMSPTHIKTNTKSMGSQFQSRESQNLMKVIHSPSIL